MDTGMLDGDQEIRQRLCLNRVANVALNQRDQNYYCFLIIIVIIEVIHSAGQGLSQSHLTKRKQ